MAKTVVTDALHLTGRVPADLPGADAEAVHRTLLGAEFMNRLGRAIRATIPAFPEPARVRMSVAR